MLNHRLPWLRWLSVVGFPLAILIAWSPPANADKSGTRPNVISVPRGPGSIEGLGESFQVNLNSGSVTESVPLTLPPGTAGFAPQLSLVYDSGGGNGPLGIGWSLPIPTIQVQTEKGLPRYDGSDRFLYQGGELVPISDGVYRLKNEGAFVRVRRSGQGWEVDLPSGVTQQFGKDQLSRIQNGTDIFSWSLEREIDRYGNQIAYTYEKRGELPLVISIDYNVRAGAAANRIELDYADRMDVLSDYRATFKVEQDRVLKEIRIFAQGEKFRRYVLDYDDEVPVHLLGSVTVFGSESGSDDEKSLPPLSFGYTGFHLPTLPVRHMSGAPATLPGSFGDAELTDMDGDGFPDILVAQTGDHTVFRNNGGLAFEPVVGIPNSPSVALGTAGVELADVDADGLVDLVARTGTTTQSFRYFPNKGLGRWESSVVFANNPSFGVEDGQTRLADLNNDKLPDALRLTGTSATSWINLGDGSWSAAQSLSLPPGSTVFDFADPRLKLADMNGDRLLDLVFVRSESIMCWPAMGFGRFDSAVAIVGAPTVNPGDESRLQLADITGDGLADLVLVGVDHVDYWVFQPAYGFSPVQTISGTPYASASLTEVRLGDMNGNGSVDVIWFTPTAAVSDRVVYLDVQDGVRPNVLSTVENGLGLKRTLKYSTSADQYQAAMDSSRPWKTRLPFSVPILADSTVEDSQGGVYTTTYSYADGYYDGGNREFRGFGRVEQRDLGDAADPTSIEIHEFDLGVTAEALKGQEITFEARSEDGALFRRRERTIGTHVYATGADGRKVTGAELSEENTWIYEGTAGSELLRQKWTYDDFGNPLRHEQLGRVVQGDAYGGDDEIITDRKFINEMDAWIIGRVYEETISDGHGKRASASRRYYDGEAFMGMPLGKLENGILTREQRWVKDDIWVDAQRLRRDGYGNAVELLSPRNGRRVVDYDETSHTFPVGEHVWLDDSREIAFGAHYLPGRAAVDWFRDANGALTRFKYDEFDRLTKIAKPGDDLDRPTFAYEYTLTKPVSSLTTMVRPRSGEDGVTTSILYADGLGRALATVSQAEDGKWVVTDQRRYSRRGSVVRDYDPYFAASSQFPVADAPAPYVEHQYDPLGRRTRTMFPDGVATETHFGPLWTEHWDGEDLEPTSRHYKTPLRQAEDGLGRIVAVTENLPGQSLVTAFSYDAAGKRTDVTNAAGNRTTYAYDGLGRLGEVVHPDAGRRWFEYDDDGNMEHAHDALGQRVDRTYDLAGRILTETQVDAGGQQLGTVTYHYDEASPRLGGEAGAYAGKLSWVDDLAGEEHFAYDARGRLTNDVRVVDGEAYQTDQTYDNLDHVTALTYPDRDKIDYLYNERGLLKGVPGIIQNIEYNAQGLATRRQFANGVASTADYDVHDRITRIASMAPDSKQLQDLNYVYDRAGTPTSIEDKVHTTGKLSATWALTSDALYRLRTASGPAGSFTYDYDAVGNFTQKSDVGNYTYDPASKPNAVRMAGDHVIKYDENGSITESFDRTFRYNPLGQLTQAGKQNVTVDFGYDFEGHRTAKRSTEGGTEKKVVYIGRFSEVRDGNLLKYVFVGDMRVARIAALKPVALATHAVANSSLGPLVMALALVILGLTLRPIRSVPRGGIAVLTLFLAATVISCDCNCDCDGDDVPPNGGRHDSVYYLHDHIGSVTASVDVDGRLVGEQHGDPWGAALATMDEPYGFTGHEWDREADLLDFEARYYDARSARFLTIDPIAVAAGLRGARIATDPQVLNAFSYARNLPTVFTDRSGLEPQPSDVWSRKTPAGPQAGRERRIALGLSGTLGGPLVPSGFIGFGVGAGVTTGHKVFVQSELKLGVGVGFIADAGVEGTFAWSQERLQAGKHAVDYDPYVDALVGTGESHVRSAGAGRPLVRMLEGSFAFAGIPRRGHGKEVSVGILGLDLSFGAAIALGVKRTDTYAWEVDDVMRGTKRMLSGALSAHVAPYTAIWRSVKYSATNAAPSRSDSSRLAASSLELGVLP